MSRVVAIIGRPNVGKSTLFNRLVGERRAIVENIPGVTRDRLYARCKLDETEFILVDTGGFDPNPEDPLLQVMKAQVELALEEADVILFMMELPGGLNPVDTEIHRMLARRKTQVFHIINKVDSPEKESLAYEFYELGVDTLYFTSAAHGRGINALSDDLIEAMERVPALPELQTDVPHVAVVGRPNVGKSTLINQLLGEERLLTSDIAGTTRDAVDTNLTTRDGKQFVLVDTAGMRRKKSIVEAIEHYSVLRSIQGIERCHVVVLLLDARYGMEDQDNRIARLADHRGRGLIFLFNKWDLIQREQDTAKRFIKALRIKYPSFAHVPVLFTSALTGRGVLRILNTVEQVKANCERRIGTGELNRYFEKVAVRNPPPLVRHRPGRIYYVTQADTAPPTFLFSVNKPEAFSDTYKRYLSNRIREDYGFEGAPLRLFFRRRKGPNDE